MRRVMALNIGVILGLGLLISGCGKNAAGPAASSGGGDSSTVTSTIINASADVTNLYNQLSAVPMNVIPYMSNQLLRTLATNTYSSSHVTFTQCTYSNNSNNQTVSLLNGLFTFNFGVSTNTCGSQTTVANLYFQSASAEVINLAPSSTGNNGVTVINRQDLMNRIFHPELSLSGMLALTLDCNGPIAVTSVTKRQQNYSSGSQQIIDFVLTETCSGTQISHTRSHTIDTNLPLVANPVRIEEGKMISSNNQYQYQPSKLFSSIFYY